MDNIDFPKDAIIIRFGTNSPYYPFTFTYGMFEDPTTQILYTSVDAYLAYYMFNRIEHRKEIMRAPNGYIAYKNMIEIIENSYTYDGDENPVISPTWEDRKDSLLENALIMKYTQSVCLAGILMRTGDRPIFDSSRREDEYWCVGGGNGLNKHGKILERVRNRLRLGMWMIPKF